MAIAGVLVVGAFVWAYWPTIVKLVEAWNREPDYSHGYFVIPVALFFLYARRDSFPGFRRGLAWPGLVLIALSIGVRMFGARYYVDAIDGWSMLFWVAGVVWLLFGWRVLGWSAPSIVFLLFMIPLPWRMERMLSVPLQSVATRITCWGLQCLGQPALYAGNMIFIDDLSIQIDEELCSGLRIFIGILALAFAFDVLVRRPWWEKALLLVSAIPVAILANSARIMVTGILWRYVSGETAHKWSHDLSGYLMIPFAAALLAIVAWYLSRLLREVELLAPTDYVSRDGI